MGEHRALRPSGRSGGVEDRRDVVGFRDDRVERRRPVVRPVEQRPFPARERQHLRRGAERQRALGGSLSTDDNRRLRVAEEIGELAPLVAGVERQVDEAGAQAGEIERERLPTLVHLHGDAIAALRTRLHQRVRDARRRGVEIVVVDDRTVRNQQAGLIRAFREMRGEEGVEVGVHPGAWT